ncbi:1-aminocyclopropane-1-carboxylate deaminase/D-cysteine desulfhydrase [Vibrio salinus]|uniref:1-aminocyclopropane-1-carboxylate deaminase/D-cysteine desulfhydrase n=1 Tax=Vibrio salinus TaxID=2899784 RepID=UPI001E35EB97|nr:1-aminocyclopropane-1-carboxylate deaminase/D-cysteine desulfhydrase [Vibrio salinus]MCE0492760.1 1-aminocyclopropane-1-carboxylate deaminase/D-cysteine desulfhydrase [Vibrio salinus]
MTLSHSPVTKHTYQDYEFYLKRDDQLHPQFSGNKARKLKSLVSSPPAGIRTLISYGSPQANSLYSFSALAHLHNWEFEFYVDHIPDTLVHSPIGNYKGALGLGANIIPVSETAKFPIHPRDYIHQVRQPDERCLVVPEGGRCHLAKEGVYSLADELLTYIELNQLHNVVVALPSGTGTTAVYLNHALSKKNIKVITCACVGGNDYLTKQFSELLPDSHHPEILSLCRKMHFGKLYDEYFQIWNELFNQTGVEFDLLYDPLMWRCLQQWLPKNKDKTLIYIHQGGILGNESMKARYRYFYRNK